MLWWPAAMLLWLAGVGLQLNQVAPASLGWAGVVGLVSLIILVLGMLLCRVHGRQHWAPWSLLALLPLAWAVTTWRAAERLAEHVPPSAESKAGVLTQVQVQGLVQMVQGAWLFDAQVLAYKVGQDQWLAPREAPAGPWPSKVAVRLTVGCAADQAAAPQPGQQWEMPLRMSEPDGLFNPGGYDTALGYWERGIRALAQTKASQARLVSESPQHVWQAWVDRLRTCIRERIRLTVPDARLGGVLAGLAIGDQSAIDRDDWDVFRLTGVSHLVSISGTHVAMFGWLAAGLVKFFWSRLGATRQTAYRLTAPDAARIGGVVAALAYAMLAGWGVPAQRTVVMMAAFSGLRMAGRQWPWPLILLGSAVVVTLWDPWACMQAGFWLSFVAVGILMAQSPNAGASDDGARPSMWQRIKAVAVNMGVTQWRVSLGLAPLSLVFFQQTSVVGFVANLWAIPVFTFVITPFALAGVLVTPLWTFGAQVVSWALSILASMAQWPVATVQAPLLPWWASVSVVLAGAVMLLPMRWAWRLACVPFLLPLAAMPARWHWWPSPVPGQFSILAADVGQGTAVLVRTARHSLLFDAGPKVGMQSDAGARVVVPLLRAAGVGALDTVMISHADADHVGGAPSVFKAVPVGVLRSSLVPSHALLQTPGADGRVPTHQECVAGQSWLWDGVVFRVLRPTQHDLDHRDQLGDNAVSCVLQIEAQADAHGSGRRALLTGDIEAEQEQQLLASMSPASLRADLLVVPHHGSQTSSTEPFLQAVQPRMSVMQVGKRNRYGHPSPSVLARYQDMRLPFVATPACGAFLWVSDDASHRGECWRERRHRYWHVAVKPDEARSFNASSD